MKLSIIIPVYNEVKYLKRCLNTVYANGDVEVIIVDDGSTDGSDKVAEDYAKAHNFIFLRQDNSGVSVARNLGIAKASGKYVTFLDSDDYYMPNAIRIMLRAIGRFDYPVIQFNHSRTRYDNKECRCSLNKLPSKWVLVWNKVYRRDFLLENNIQFPVGVIFEEDRIFNLRCFHYCDYIYSCAERTVYKCFDNKSSICHTVDKKKVLSSSAALTDLLAIEDKPEVQKIIRRCLKNLWDAETTKRAFGGAE